MKLRNKLTGLALGLVSAIAPSQEYNWKDVEIITPEEATQRYGEAQLPLNVYSSFDDFIQETEYNTQPLRVSVGEGEYKSNISKSVIIDYPIILSGNSKDKPKIKTTIAANDYLETDNISFDGDSNISHVTFIDIAKSWIVRFIKSKSSTNVLPPSPLSLFLPAASIRNVG